MGRSGEGMARLRCAARALLAAWVVAAFLAEGQEEVSMIESEHFPAGEPLVAIQEAAGKITVNLTGKQKAPVKSSDYARIPNFVMKHMSQEQTVGNRLACEKICNKHSLCRSYSYRRKDKLCMWSISRLRYHYSWNFFTKVHTMDAFGHMLHNGHYRKFPGLMYQEPGYKKFKKKTVKQCTKLCTSAKKCKAFSFHESGGECLLTDAGVHYDPQFEYFEKPIHKATGSPERKKKSGEKRLQVQEIAAKKGKRDRIMDSIKERKAKDIRAYKEGRAKKMDREIHLKKQQKAKAEKTLANEKKKEKHAKRMARMKAAYNEGYFKAKGVSAEKKIKERNLKKLRKKEVWAKGAPERNLKKAKKIKIQKERAKKKHERHVKKDLLQSKEKLVKLKNKAVETDIKKEEKVLDVAKNLALVKDETHDDVVVADKRKKAARIALQKDKTHERKEKAKATAKVTKAKAKKLAALKKGAEDVSSLLAQDNLSRKKVHHHKKHKKHH